jgi:hypothetical protein
MDGGSTDGSADIIRKHAHRLAHFQSAPDKGQYHAIQEGFTHATGDIFAWLNSDDMYFPWTLGVVAEVFARFPEIRWVVGTICYMNTKGQVTDTMMTAGGLSQHIAAAGGYGHRMGSHLPQEGMFWRRDLWEETGGLDTRYQIAAEFELWTRFARHTAPVSLKCLVAAFRVHPAAQRSQTARDVRIAEETEVQNRIGKAPPGWRLFGRSNATNLLYRMLFPRGPSVSVAYDPVREQWTLHKQPKGRLYRPFVVPRKV